MRIHLIAVGQKMPGWVTQGYQEYTKRLPRECRLELHEIAPGHRGKGQDPKRAMADEGQRMLAAIPRDTRVIALDERGKNWSTPDVSKQLGNWLGGGQDVCLLVGGPDGLSPECKQCADQTWSLSRLVFPHPVVRILLAEQLYRAWSLLNNHPYHRA